VIIFTGVWIFFCGWESFGLFAACNDLLRLAFEVMRSFFGVADRRDESIAAIIEDSFGIWQSHTAIQQRRFFNGFVKG
jgi:hypothetical protein